MTLSNPSPAASDDHSPTDPELLARHAAGDPDAFTQLFRRHRDRLWAIALRTLCDPDEAADALQDAMLSAFRNASSFRGDSAVTTWLHRVVVNACLDRIRRRAVRAADPLPDDDRVAELGSTTRSDPAELQEMRLDILSALGSLNPDQRAAIVLVDMEGYSVDEAAAILGCPPGTIKSRCARGRAKLVPLLQHLRSGRPGARTLERHQARDPRSWDDASLAATSGPPRSDARSPAVRGNPDSSSDVQRLPRDGGPRRGRSAREGRWP